MKLASVAHYSCSTTVATSSTADIVILVCVPALPQQQQGMATGHRQSVSSGGLLMSICRIAAVGEAGEAYSCKLDLHVVFIGDILI